MPTGVHNSHKGVPKPRGYPKPTAPAEMAAIATALIDDPLRPSRETFDEEKLQELISSIRDAGLIQPISVVRNGERFRCMAGHRRLIACRALKHETIRCSVYPEGTALSAIVQVHENAIREDLNPAEESTYWWELLENECGGDVNNLVALLKLTRGHVEARLLLKTGDPDVFEALGKGIINAGVAEELNKVKDRIARAVFLDAAVKGGASRRLIREWRGQGEALASLNPAPPIIAGAAAAAPPQLETPKFVCACCDYGPEAGAIEMVYMHKQCKRVFLDRIQQVYEAKEQT